MKTNPRFATGLSIGILIGIVLFLGGSMMMAGGNEKRDELLDPLNKNQAPPNAALMTGDDELKTYIRTYGLVPTMRALVAASQSAGIDCHDRAHRFGRFSYEEFGDEVLKMNLPECHSGFYHGAIEAYFKKNGTADLQQKLPVVCPQSLNDFFDHQCFHGLGHGLMAWSGYDLPGTLEYCNLLPQGMNQASCRTGIFMENLIGSLTDSPEARARGHFTRYISDDPQYPCNIVKDEYKADCYFLQTDRMMALSKTGWKGVADECAKAPPLYQYSCFASMGRTVGGYLRAKPLEALAACRLVQQGQLREACIDGVAKDTLWDKDGQDTGFALCAVVPPEDGRQVCYMALVSQARGVMTAAEYDAFCGKMPPEYQDVCRLQAPA